MSDKFQEASLSLSSNLMAMKSQKHTCVSLEAKLEIINHLKKGESQSSLASEYSIGKSTVGDFKKNEEKIREFATTMESLDVSTKKCKFMRLANDDTLDQALYLWFVQICSISLFNQCFIYPVISVI